ncbi:hypothetical protein GCM10027043_36330 [Ferruginibacter profundus]
MAGFYTAYKKLYSWQQLAEAMPYLIRFEEINEACHLKIKLLLLPVHQEALVKPLV